MLGIRLEICRVIVYIGIGCCNLTQASGRRSRLDCVSFKKTAEYNECVTSGNVANPIQVTNARRDFKLEEDIPIRVRCNEVHCNLSSPSHGIVVVNEDRFALND